MLSPRLALALVAITQIVGACAGSAPSPSGGVDAATSRLTAPETAAPAPSGPTGTSVASAAASAPVAPVATPVASSAASASPFADPSAAASAAPSLPPVPHALLSINDTGAFRGIISAARWSPAGPASVRSFGRGIPAADDPRQLPARVGSVLTVALEKREMRKLAVYGVRVADFGGAVSTGAGSTGAPLAALRRTSSAVKRGERVTFWAPDSGEWILYAQIGYPDGAGDGTYFWRILVK